LDELVERNPSTFAEIREVATCISNILDNDGYAAAVKKFVRTRKQTTSSAGDDLGNTTERNVRRDLLQ
jgi:hypothetical protein